MSCFSVVPRSADQPLLLVAGMVETAGMEIFVRMEKKVHEALIKAEFCPYLQVIFSDPLQQQGVKSAQCSRFTPFVGCNPTLQYSGQCPATMPFRSPLHSRESR